MEALVTMTTRVPDGTSAHAVDDMRAREAAHTRDLVARGRVLRLWRPPLGPGEWRTLGLFDAQDAEELEKTLASMPLRVWRSDEVTELSTHPNDPGRGAVPRAPGRSEHLVTFVLRVPDDASPETVADLTEREARSAHELSRAGHLVRLWTTGPGTALGLWQVDDADQLDAILRSLPLAGWLTVEGTDLTPHPSDPGARRR